MWCTFSYILTLERNFVIWYISAAYQITECQLYAEALLSVMDALLLVNINAYTVIAFESDIV